MDTIDAPAATANGYGVTPPVPPRTLRYTTGPPPRHPGTVATRDPGAMAGPPEGAKASSDPLDGIAALNMLSKFYAHYDYWDHPAYPDLLAAWTLQYHATEEDGSPVWRALGRLVISGMHGTGKSGTLDLVSMATGAVIPVDLTYPGIRDAIGKHNKGVIIDDAQLVFGTGMRAERVRKVINAHTKGRVGLDATNGEIPLYGHIAMAGLPELLSGKVSYVIRDTLSRCFVLWKARKPQGMHIPEVTDSAEAVVKLKAVKGMKQWCRDYREALRARAAEFGQGEPTGLPDLGDGGRGNDQLARPLLAACDVATSLAREAWCEAGNDGEIPDEHNWSERIRAALIHVAGVPEPTGDETSSVEDAAKELEAMWAASDTPAEPTATGWDEREPGRVVFGDDLDAPAPPPVPPYAPTPPRARYTALYAITDGPGSAPQVHEFGEPFGSLTGAQAACESLHQQALGQAARGGQPLYGGPLDWQPSPRQANTWGATFRPPGEQYPEISYAVSMAGE